MKGKRPQLGLSQRDRRTLALGSVCVASLFTVARGIPALRDWETDHLTAAQTAALQAATVREGLRLLPALRDSVRARMRRLMTIDSLLPSGDSPSSIAAAVASTLESIADDNAFKIAAMQLHADTVPVAGLTRVQVRVTGTTDVAGLAGFLHDVERGDTLLTIREMNVSQPEPAASSAKPEMLHVDVLVAGIGVIRTRRVAVHRDIKAENILIEHGTERALVTDFGIARLAEAAPLTATGQVLGTVYYTSPEQVSGDPVDARTDIYSLGVLAYLALSGRFPFEAELASAVLVAHVTKTPPPLQDVAPDTPRPLADIVDQCLAKDPTRRPQRCADLLDALRAITPDIERLPIPATHGAPALDRAKPLVSDTEARAILGRAADLQAMTGIQPRPLPERRERDALLDASRTSGHRPDAIRDAAVEAGIDAKYVDHAFVEHGLRDPGLMTAAPRGEIVNRSAPPHGFLGSPTRLEFEVVVEGEMPLEDFDLLLEVIRQSAGEAGEMAAVGRSFSWQNHADKGHVHVSVLPRGGKTTIRVSENLKQAAGGFFGGIMGGAGGGATPIWVGIAVKTGHLGLVAGLWCGGVGLAYLGARTFFGMHSRRRAAALRRLAERLALQARESIDTATTKLAPPSSS